MRVWVTASGNSLDVRLYREKPTWNTGYEEHEGFGDEMLARTTARRLFGRLPRHGSDECFEFEVTARRITRRREKR